MTPVALVTGAARGIGAATVEALAARGWDVVAVDRCADDPRLPYRLGTEEDLGGMVERASESSGREVLPAVADAADLGAMTAAVHVAEERLGGLDAIVTAAGVFAGGVPSWELSQGQEDAVFEVDLHAVAVAARTAIPAMLRRSEPRHGRFIAISSAAAAQGLRYVAAYCAAKAGVEGMVRGLAADLGGTGITANAVSPGSTNTPMLVESARVYGIEPSEFVDHQSALGRLIEPEETAAAIAWLAGEGADAITGAVIPVDGGMSL